MPSSTTSILPDVNIWLALVYAAHPHHLAVRRWFELLNEADALAFCRVTQMGFLRLVTQQKVVGAGVLTQAQAWAAYDRLLLDPRITYLPEPDHLEAGFRTLTAREAASPKLWTDDYLLAFAQAAGLALFTLDRALAGRSAAAFLLP